MEKSTDINNKYTINNNSIKPKKIVYKNLKDVPEHNPQTDLCDYFIQTKMRFCKFTPMNKSKYCVHHNYEIVIKCDNCLHTLFKDNIERHKLYCKYPKEKALLESNEWYKKNINLLRRIDNLSEENNKIDLSTFLEKITNTYKILKEEYTTYLKNSKFSEYLTSKNDEVDNNTTELYCKGYLVSSLDIKEEDLNSTLQLSKLKKHGSQKLAITKVMKDFGLLNNYEDDSYIFIEFGAGKGGLTETIINSTNNKSNYILLEREGVRHKKDKCSDNCVRFRTDILDFDINYLPYVINNKYKFVKYRKNTNLNNQSSNNDSINDNNNTNNDIKHIKETDLKLIGIAKHICGCALDMSAFTLLNYKHGYKGLCFASCCHHLGNINNFLGYDILKEKHKFENKEILFLFKATSWLFEDENKEISNSYSKYFKNMIEKKKIGIICKYIIDLCRVFYIMSFNKDVLYIKYCSNEITTENNLIISIC